MYNLSVAFPNKTQKEKVAIAKKFYRNFSDTMAETVKLFSADRKFIENHFTAEYEVLNDIYNNNRKCQLHMGHNFNWELGALVVPFHAKHNILAVYMPIGNKVIDRILKKLRTKTGTILISATNFRNEIKPWLSQPYLLGLIADQNPPVPANAFWINFFGRPTPFLKGPELGARSSNSVIVFANITKSKRGYYHGQIEVATDDASSMELGQLTLNYARYLEKVITAYPEMWLWTHRRWKHEWKPDYGPVID